jgi:hypothetical protein
MTTGYRLLTVKEYAALVRRHEQSIYRAIRLRTLRREIVRDGRCILIRVPAELAPTKAVQN